MAWKHFWRKVDKNTNNGCWLWVGATTKGYGRTRVDKRHGYAHRFSWEYHYGPIEDGLQICHKCDVPLCVRPDHLFLGSAADNVLDKIQKGRARHGVSIGEQNGFAKLKNSDIARIANLRGQGKTIYEIAGAVGISKSHVWNIVSGKNWRNVYGV